MCVCVCVCVCYCMSYMYIYIYIFDLCNDGISSQDAFCTSCSESGTKCFVGVITSVHSKLKLPLAELRQSVCCGSRLMT